MGLSVVVVADVFAFVVAVVVEIVAAVAVGLDGVVWGESFGAEIDPASRTMTFDRHYFHPHPDH